MSSFRTVKLKDVRRMLDRCARGARIEPKKHRNWVYHDDKIFRGLPLGSHGKRNNPDIEIGHVRQLIRFFGIDHDCAHTAIPALG